MHSRSTGLAGLLVLQIASGRSRLTSCLSGASWLGHARTPRLDSPRRSDAHHRSGGGDVRNLQVGRGRRLGALRRHASRTKNVRLVGRIRAPSALCRACRRRRKTGCASAKISCVCSASNAKSRNYVPVNRRANTLNQRSFIPMYMYRPTGTGDRGMVAILVTSSRARNIRLPNQGRPSGRSPIDELSAVRTPTGALSRR